MKYFISFVLGLFFQQATAQNHVPNHSFENYTQCPATLSLADRCVNWWTYTYGSTDYYNSCNPSPAEVGVPFNFGGYQHAAAGQAYMGMITYSSQAANYKEYIAAAITPLQTGAAYEVSLSVNIPDRAGWACNDLGVFFFDAGPAVVITQGPLAVTPQVSYTGYGILSDTANWIRLKGILVADSAYDNIVIGGFTPQASLNIIPQPIGGATSLMNACAYYWIDSIVIRALPKFSVDTLFCAGDTVDIPYIAGSSYYTTGNVFTVQLSNAAGSFATPVNIGSLASTTSGTVQIVLPATASGTGYRMRIVASNPADTSVNNGRNITIKPKPFPTATSNSPVCMGSALALSATALLGSSYSWTGPSFSSAQQNTGILNVNNSHAGDYIVTATLNGCTAKDTTTVFITALPATSVAGNNGPVCAGTTVTLTAVTTTAGATYSWNGPSTFSSTAQNPAIPNTTAANAGTYNVTATANGCTSAAGSTVVQIKALPTLPAAGSNSPVCAGGLLNLTANSSTTGVSYSWTGPNGFTSTSQNPSISPVPLNAGGTYNVTAEANGCTSAPGSTTVVVNNVSSLGVYPSPNDTVCINNANASFVAVPFNAGTAPQYQWYKNNNLISGATAISYPATGIADGDSFYCRMTVTSLCADPLVLYSNKVGMTVLPVTAGPTVSITADPGTLLSPWQLVKFTAVASNAGALPKYQWKRNSQDVIGATSDVWSANNLSNGDTISCVVTSGVWCASPADAVSNRMVVNIKTGIEDIDVAGTLTLYPNPNNGSFVVYLPAYLSSGGYVTVEVMNTVGQLVYKSTTQPVNRSTFEIALPASISNGMYILKFMADDKVHHARFTVNR